MFLLYHDVRISSGPIKGDHSAIKLLLLPLIRVADGTLSSLSIAMTDFK